MEFVNSHYFVLKVGKIVNFLFYSVLFVRYNISPTNYDPAKSKAEIKGTITPD